MARLSFGIKTAPQHTTYEAMLAVWQAADATPVFEHAWLFDHFAPSLADQLRAAAVWAQILQGARAAQGETQAESDGE
jgi:hypothetical protein